MMRIAPVVSQYAQMPHIDLLDSMPTIESSHASDLKISHRHVRVWVSRCDLADGEPYARTVYVETKNEPEHMWISAGHYDGQNPPDQIMGVTCRWHIITGHFSTSISLLWSLS
jgi:hypothetical protein